MVETKSQGTELCVSWIRSVFTHLLNLVSVKSLRDAVPSELHEMIPEKDACLFDENDETLSEKLRTIPRPWKMLCQLLRCGDTYHRDLEVGLIESEETSSCLTKWAQIYSDDRDETKILNTGVEVCRMQVMRVHEIVLKTVRAQDRSSTKPSSSSVSIRLIGASGIFATSSHWKLPEKTCVINRLSRRNETLISYQRSSQRDLSYKILTIFSDSLEFRRLEMHSRRKRWCCRHPSPSAPFASPASRIHQGLGLGLAPKSDDNYVMR